LHGVLALLVVARGKREACSQHGDKRQFQAHSKFPVAMRTRVPASVV
jgi:hypothetical protein